MALSLSASSMAASVADEPVDATGYDQSRRCLDIGRIEQVYMLDTRHVLFRVHGHWLLSLTKQACPDMSSNSTFTFESELKTRLCSLDEVTILQCDTGTVTDVGSCVLSRFEPLTDDQVDVLREAVSANGRRRLTPTVSGTEVRGGASDGKRPGD